MPSALHKEGKLPPTGSKAVTQPRLPSSAQLLLRVAFAILSGGPSLGPGDPSKSPPSQSLQEDGTPPERAVLRGVSHKLWPSLYHMYRGPGRSYHYGNQTGHK